MLELVGHRPMGTYTIMDFWYTPNWFMRLLNYKPEYRSYIGQASIWYDAETGERCTRTLEIFLANIWGYLKTKQ